MAEIIFTANAGADAELRYTKSGEPVLSFRACESKSRRLQDGTWEKLREQWFDVSLFGPAAEPLAPTIRTGARVKVAGEFWRRDYQGQRGDGTALDVRATGVQVLPSRDNAPRQDSSAGGWGNNAPTTGGDAWSGSGSTGWGDQESPF